MKQCRSFQTASAPPLWIFYHHSREFSHQAVAGKNSVNAYTTKQITLTIFYTTSCTAKPFPKGLNLANLFAHFWKHYKAMTLSKNQYHIYKLQPHIQDWSNKPLGQGLSRKAWFQLNRLWTGIGKFGDSMVKWGFGDDNLYQCGEPQTAYHIVNDCKSIGPPCNPTDVDNPMLKRYLMNCNFW